MTKSVVMREYASGALAFIDSFAGLVPCKVLSVRVTELDGITRTMVTVKVTAERRAFPRGEVSEESAPYVVPRDCVYTRCGQYRIRNIYKWNADA